MWHLGCDDILENAKKCLSPEKCCRDKLGSRAGRNRGMVWEGKEGGWKCCLTLFSPSQIDAKKKQVEEAQEEVKKAEDEFEDTKDAKAEA